MGTARRPSLPKNEHRLVPKEASQEGRISRLRQGFVEARRGDRVAMGGFGAPVRSEIGPYQSVT